MEYRLKRFLEYESKRKVKKLIAVEDDSAGGVIDIGGRKTGFICRIDRVDMLSDDSILILDYKTGASASVPSCFSSLNKDAWDRKIIKAKIHSFQLPLYLYFARRKYGDIKMKAALYNLRKPELSYFPRFRGALPAAGGDNSKDELNSAERIMDICMEALEYILEEIFDPKHDFEPDESNPRICGHCPFTCLCR